MSLICFMQTILFGNTSRTFALIVYIGIRKYDKLDKKRNSIINSQLNNYA
jgi:hypothetical protein